MRLSHIVFCNLHSDYSAIFQFFKTFGPENERHLAALPSLTPSGNVEGYIYTGNAVADAQVMVAKAVLDGVLTATPELQTIPNSINMNIISWAMSADGMFSNQASNALSDCSVCFPSNFTVLILFPLRSLLAQVPMQW
jgi:hypothetical protein